MNYLERIDSPEDSAVNGKWVSPNTGVEYAQLNPLSNSLVTSLLGEPAESKTVNCREVTNPKIHDMLTTASVGPFKVTGLFPAVKVLRRILTKVGEEKPELYKLLGTAGMLCCRKVRGGHSWSNHSWGLAHDFLVGNVLDDMGDNKCLRGLLELYPYFHAEGWWWGTEFGREDSMHFEASRELLLEWRKLKVI